MLIEIANNTTREIFRSKNGFSLIGDNGLILGYVHTDEGEHVVEVERFYKQEAVLSHFKSREDAIKFICTFEHELPRLHTVYDKLHTLKGVGAFHVFNPVTSYPFHVGLDSDTHLHFSFGDVGTGKTIVSYAEQDTEVTRDYFMQTMNSVLHDLVYSSPLGMGYQSLPILPTMTDKEKSELIESFLSLVAETSQPKQPQVDPNRPVIQPSDKPYNFEDIHEIIKNSTYHPPKCPFTSSGSNVHTVFIADPHISDTLGIGTIEGIQNPYKNMSNEQLHALVKQLTTLGSISKDSFTNSATKEGKEVPKPQHVQMREEKADKKQSERNKTHENRRGGHKSSTRGHKYGNKGNKPKSPYTSHRRKQK